MKKPAPLLELTDEDYIDHSGKKRPPLSFRMKRWNPWHRAAFVFCTCTVPFFAALALGYSSIFGVLLMMFIMGCLLPALHLIALVLDTLRLMLGGDPGYEQPSAYPPPRTGWSEASASAKAIGAGQARVRGPSASARLPQSGKRR